MSTVWAVDRQSGKFRINVQQNEGPHGGGEGIRQRHPGGGGRRGGDKGYTARLEIKPVRPPSTWPQNGELRNIRSARVSGRLVLLELRHWLPKPGPQLRRLGRKRCGKSTKYTGRSTNCLRKGEGGKRVPALTSDFASTTKKGGGGRRFKETGKGKGIM